MNNKCVEMLRRKSFRVFLCLHNTNKVSDFKIAGDLYKFSANSLGCTQWI
jgi:hypothetical protein